MAHTYWTRFNKHFDFFFIKVKPFVWSIHDPSGLIDGSVLITLSNTTQYMVSENHEDDNALLVGVGKGPREDYIENDGIMGFNDIQMYKPVTS